MFLSEDQMKMVATILVVLVAARCAIKRLCGCDILSVIGTGTVSKVFYVAVAASVVYLVYLMVQANSYNLPTMYRMDKDKEVARRP
jgi:hypothetical protein